MQVDLIHESISAKETILFALLSRAEVHNLVRSDLESEDGDVSGLNRRRYCDRRFAEVVVAVVEADVMDDAQLRFLFFRGVLLNEGDVMLLRLSVVEDVVLADSAAVANDVLDGVVEEDAGVGVFALTFFFLIAETTGGDSMIPLLVL
mmetsp:Transcript_24060/g.35600  ORF Transcript_24060/g.35600 Transcript_24060/m.35600 type:complete len:148 (-) Transcript_24060:1071-1514(-)